MGLFSWLFKKKDAPIDPDAEPQEKWESNPKNPDWRWESESETDYAADVDDSGVRLTLHRERLYAWAVNPLYRYRNFALKSSLCLETEGYAAGGFLFRFMDDSSFYSCLVSNRGQFRVDVVFNGSPIPLIPWTPVPGKFDPKQFELVLIARDETLTVVLDGLWAGETTDDMIDRGRLALAGQTYSGAASVKLTCIELENREVPVEKALEHWEDTVPPAASQRQALAESLASSMRFREAAFQLSKLRASGELSREGVLLLSQCWLEDGLYSEALGAVEEILKKETWDMALKQKASILYLMSRYLDLRDFVLPLTSEFPQEGALWMSLGHAQDQLGNWKEAAEAYGRWAELEPDQPFAWLYAGNLWEKAGDNAKAMESYPRAADLFFRQEAMMDLEGVLEKMKRLAPESGALAAMEGKIAFGAGQTEKALALFQKSRSLGVDDPAADYLEGMTARDNGDREAALEKFRSAAQKEPGYGLFRFRYAETLYLLEDSNALEEARAACESDPQNPWVWNLLGLCLEGPEEKADAFEKAHRLEPDLEEPFLNFAGALCTLGRGEEAEKMLRHRGSAGAWNLLGRLRSDAGLWEEAESFLDRALLLHPNFEDALANMRRPLWEQGKMGKLERVLSQLLELRPEEPGYLLDLAETAWSLGDWPRGEVALRILLGIEPAHAGARRALMRHYMGRFRYDKVIDILTESEKTCPNEDWSEWRKALRSATQDRLSCAACGREWWLPKNFSDPGRLRLVGEPPPEAPGGKSQETGKIYCVSCAQQHVSEGRFLCPETGGPLVLDKALVYLLKQYLEPDA